MTTLYRAQLYAMLENIVNGERSDTLFRLLTGIEMTNKGVQITPNFPLNENVFNDLNLDDLDIEALTVIRRIIFDMGG